MPLPYTEEQWAKWIDWFDDHYVQYEPCDEWRDWAVVLEVAPQIKDLVNDKPQNGFPARPMTNYYFCSFLANYTIPERREILRAITWQLIENDLVDLLAIHSRSKAK